MKKLIRVLTFDEDGFINPFKITFKGVKKRLLKRSKYSRLNSIMLMEFKRVKTIKSILSNKSQQPKAKI